MDDSTSDLPDELVIELVKPIEAHGTKFAEIRLREPTIGEVRKAESHLRKGLNAESGRQYQINLVAIVSGMPQDVVEQLPISVVNRGLKYVLGFIEAGQETGTT